MLNLRNSERYPNLVPLFKKHNNDYLVYFTTNASSQKINQIKNNLKVSVYYSKPSEWRGLMLGGTIEIVKEQAIKKSLWQDAWTMYYPGGPTDNDYTILKLTPDVLKLYHQLDFFTLYPE
jgi:general stress protein 26